MTDEWVTGPLSEFAEVSRLRTDPRLLGDEPLVHYSIPVLDETGLPVVEVATGIASHKFRVARDSVLVSLLNPRIPRVWKAIGAPNAVCSTEFAVLAPAAEDLETDFLHLVCQSEVFWEELQKRAVGTTGSRQRAKTEGLLSISVAIPPLPVQRRIVDLMAHLDDHVASLRAEHAEATLVLSRLRAEVYGAGADQVRLGDLARVDRGASWSAKQEIEEGGHPVIRIANVQPEGFDLSEVRRVEGLKPRDIARSSIGEGSILLVGSNGNPERIGNAYLSDPALQGAVLASFLIGVHTESRDEAEFIWHCLCAPKVQAAITASTAGSTGLKNLSIEWLRELGIPQPDTERRNAALALLRAANAVVLDLSTEIARLALIRSGLLESLLHRQANISEAYDDFLYEVA